MRGAAGASASHEPTPVVRMNIVMTSCMLISITWPSPVRWRCTYAARMAIAVWAPVAVSRERAAGTGRRTVRGPGEREQPGGGLGEHVEAAVLGVRDRTGRSP